MGRKLLFTAHHTVVDSVSWRILVEDLVRMLEQNRQDKAFALPEKTASVLSWSKAVRTYALNIGDEEKNYWRGVESCGFLFPSDYEGEDDVLSRCGTVKRSLDAGATGRLLGPANAAYGTKPDEIMLAALALAVCDTAGTDGAVVELEGHGREEADDTIDVSRTVGWFTCIYPVILKSCGQDLPAHIKGIKEQLRKVPGKGMGYSALKYITGELSENLGKRIRFNYLGELDNTPDSGLLAISDMNSGEESDLENNLTALIDINAMVCGRSLRVQAAYSRSRFSDETVCRWMDRFLDSLMELINFCCGRKSADYTPSDFDMVSFSQDELDAILTDF
jgi:non-ribosomal peptide synthase protein (TIGR01720 family)